MPFLHSVYNYVILKNMYLNTTQEQICMGVGALEISHYRSKPWIDPHMLHIPIIYDDIIRWKHFPHYWPFVWGIHLSPVNSQHKGQWRRALMFSLICVWIKGWVTNRESGDYDISVMMWWQPNGLHKEIVSSSITYIRQIHPYGGLLSPSDSLVTYWPFHQVAHVITKSMT